MNLLSYNLADVKAPEIRSGLASLPSPGGFSEAGAHIIRAIHAIPALFEGVDLGNIVIYLGRAAATPPHVVGRFREHESNKGHEYGAMLLKAPTKVVLKWEAAAIRLLHGIMRRGALCVQNLAIDERGPEPAHPESIIYMTWKVVAWRDVRVATRYDIQRIAEDAAQHYGNDRLESEFLMALDPLSRPRRDLADIEWHHAHMV